MKLSVIIPVYNGEKTIEELFARLCRELGNGSNWEVLFVYDCGRDNSWEVIKQIVRLNPGRVRAYRLDRNYGQHRALTFGMKEAGGEYIITLDEDLQHDPAHIGRMTTLIKQGGYDVVYARFRELKHPGTRIATSEMLRKVLKHIVPGIDPSYSPLRIIRRETARQIIQLRNPYTFIDGYLGMVTTGFGHVDCEHYRRADGRSSYTFRKLFSHAIKIAIAYSPLKRWLIIASLVLNSAAAFLFFTFKNETGGGGIRIAALILASAGIATLLLSLMAEIVHYRGLKNNTFPKAVEVI